MEKETLLSKKQICEMLQCCPRQVDYLREKHGLPSLHIGGLVRFQIESVRQWIKNQEQAEKGKAD